MSIRLYARKGTPVSVLASHREARRRKLIVHELNL